MRATVTGTAPTATLVPLRVVKRKPFIGITPVMFRKAARRLRDAIRHAIHNNCHVISVSLGTKSNVRSLRKAINEAVDAGVIVLAAAGNAKRPFVGKKVIYPARYPSVIAVAACNIEEKPWKRSAKGPEVDITAPGESVWRAVIDDQGNSVVKRSSGTSYAVATVAGLAALWLSFHDRDKLMEKYKDPQGKYRGLVAAFRNALHASARLGHPSLDKTEYGGGIVDAVELLRVNLPNRGSNQHLNVFSEFAQHDTIDALRARFPDMDDKQLGRGLNAVLGIDPINVSVSPRASGGSYHRQKQLSGSEPMHHLEELLYLLDTDSRVAREFKQACEDLDIPHSGKDKIQRFRDGCQRNCSESLKMQIAETSIQSITSVVEIKATPVRRRSKVKGKSKSRSTRKKTS